MPRPKGLPKTGGKVKGTQHKANTAFREEILKRDPTYHPIVAMFEMSKDEKLDPILRFNAYKEVAKYFEPQLKAIELKGTIDTTETITVEFYDAQKGKST